MYKLVSTKKKLILLKSTMLYEILNIQLLAVEGTRLKKVSKNIDLNKVM